MTRKPRPSTNPRSKAFQARVQKLARTIFFAGKVRAGRDKAGVAADISWAIAQSDPGAPRDVVARAIAMAAQEAVDLIVWNEEENRELRDLLSALERVQPPRPMLRVIDGGRDRAKSL